MKKTILYFLGIAITTLLCCSCEDNSTGKYPADNIRFLVGDEVSIKHPTQVIYTTSWSGWNPELYPMELWVEETEMASVDNQGYVTGHKLGTFTLHAKVMGKHGWVEGSKQFTVSDVLSQISISGINYFRRLGVDTNNDSVISASELERIEVLEERIHSDFLLSLAQYLPNLKEVSVIADISPSRTLDLSMFKLRKLTIIDDCVWSDEEYEEVEPYFLTDLKLNNCIEHIVVNLMPGFPVMDLSNYTNLKTISREYNAPPKWADMTFILPPNIELIDLRSAAILFNHVCPKLTTIRLTHCMPITIPKEKVPNLKNIIYKYDGSYPDTNKYDTTLDISSYEASDLDEVYIEWIDALYVSQSVKDKFFKYADSNKIIIK
jgi:hypothetical protein